MLIVPIPALPHNLICELNDNLMSVLFSNFGIHYWAPSFSADPLGSNRTFLTISSKPL